MSECGVLLPTFHPCPRGIEGDSGCIREHSWGPHLNRMADGSYVVWESDYECTDCEAVGEGECYVWTQYDTLEGAEIALQVWDNA